MYLRARRHLSADHGSHVKGTVATGFFFDTKGFLQEALHLAYKEVWYGLAGQLPRPIMASAFGVELVIPTETAVDALVRGNASNDEPDAGAGAKSAAEGYYGHHQWASRYQRSASEAGSSDDDSSTLVGEENMGLADAADSISIGLSA